MSFFRRARLKAQVLQVQSAKLDETARMIGTIFEKNGIGNIDLKAVADAGNMTLIELTSPDNKVSERFERPLPPDQKAELDGIIVGLRTGGEKRTGLAGRQGF